ncbi:MAG: proline dehydrogenase family protein [Chloroherpetonaceae bacterium]|nr:proline dehydrogenase family protein [Chthonomonadaceae bacterium]MDW8208456.1 proline dehydrogenase family protein [Chloroherpetonaceae bacterium]
MLTRSLLLQLAGNKKMEAFIKQNAWSARMAARFVAGETVESVIEPVRQLNAQGLAVSLDFLGESVTNQEEVALVMDTYLRLFQVIREVGLNAYVSLKLTALGLDISPELCYRNMQRLLKAASPDLFVRIDMESSLYTQRTLDLFERLWNDPEPFRNVGVVIQAYLYRSAEDIERLNAMGARVRLCKGAYREPPSVAFPRKADVDASFVRLMQRLLLHGNDPAIATHDPKMIEATQRFAREHQIPCDRFEFQMLYGVRRDLQMRLVQEGYRVRVYTPFGTHWYPYLMRRLAERPANLWFVVKNVLRG